MKFALLIFLLPAIAMAQLKMNPEEKSCADKEGASEEDVEMFRSMMDPEERTTKCYYSCLFQLFRYSDGKRFDKEGFLSTTGDMSQKNRQIMQDLARQCDGTKNNDHCELAADIARCLMRGSS